MRFDPSGNLVSYSQSYSSDWLFGGVAALRGGGFVVVGELMESVGQDAWFIWFDETGQETRHVEILGWPQFRGVCAASDGGFYSLTHGGRPSVGQELWVVRFDSAGVLKWTRLVGGPLDEFWGGIAESADGGVFLGGRTSSSGAGGTDLLLVHLDASGNLVWQRTYGGPGNETGGVVIATPDGGAILLGSTNSFGAGGYDDWALRVDSQGDVVWQVTIGGPDDEFASRGVGLPDGGVALLGTTTSFGAGTGTEDLFLVRLAADGTVLWSRDYGDAGSQRIAGITVDGAGGLVLAGFNSTFSGGGGVLLRPGVSGEVAPDCPYDHAVTSTVLSASGGAAPGVFSVYAGSPLIVPGTPFPAMPTLAVSATCDSGTPGEVSPAVSPQPVRFIDSATLSWEDGSRNGATAFDLYRGAIAALAAGDRGSCFLAGVPTTSASDPAQPAAGDGWFYLVTGTNASGEGSRGFGAGCSLRAATNACGP